MAQDLNEFSVSHGHYRKLGYHLGSLRTFTVFPLHRPALLPPLPSDIHGWGQHVFPECSRMCGGRGSVGVGLIHFISLSLFFFSYLFFKISFL